MIEGVWYYPTYPKQLSQDCVLESQGQFHVSHVLSKVSLVAHLSPSRILTHSGKYVPDDGGT